ncbi:MAG: hypothetical protein IJQ21_11235 [Lachnospiraceae bacterium]|nr:hypothetical protein [Lachnospiraceae bacterium]
MAKRRRAGKRNNRRSRIPVIAAMAIILICVAVGLILFFNTPARKLARALNTGERELADGDYIRAMDAYRDALSLDEKNETAYRGLVEACGAFGDAQGVFDAYTQAVMYLSPEDAGQLRETALGRLGAIGEAFFAGGDYDNTRSVAALIRQIDEAAAVALLDRVIEVTAPAVGSTVAFGNLNGTQLEWQVLDRQGSRVLLYCTRVVETRPFTETVVGVSWAYCTLRTYLNRDWIARAFTPEEQGRIAEVAVENPANPTDSQTVNRNATEDRVFPLSMPELQTFFPNDSDRALGEGYWTRTSAYRSDTGAMTVTDAGAFAAQDVRDGASGIRPALWMILE